MSVFKEIIPVYAENNTRLINTKCGVTGLNQVVHTLTAGI
jgi:hypothetical protein